MYLEGMAASSIFVHVGIIDLTGKVIYVSLKIACCCFFLFVCSHLELIFFCL